MPAGASEEYRVLRRDGVEHRLVRPPVSFEQLHAIGPTANPRPGRSFGGTFFDLVRDTLQRQTGGEVAFEHLVHGGRHGMHVHVVNSWHCHFAAKVDHRRAGADIRLDLCVAPHADEPTVADRYGLDPRTRGIDRIDSPIEKCHVCSLCLRRKRRPEKPN